MPRISNPHKSSHQNGGFDEIDLTGLSGVLAEAQLPQAHGSSHENGELDEISVAGLSGELADDQPPKSHGSTKHNATVLDTVAKLLAASIRQTYNRLEGITPTFTVFTTNPSNPGNMTDEDWTTESGEGVKTVTAAATVGTIDFDMGANYPVLVIARANAHRDAGTGTIYMTIDVSLDGTTFYGSGVDAIAARTTDAYTPMSAQFLYGRYVRLRFGVVGVVTSGTFHVKVAEVMALQLY